MLLVCILLAAANWQWTKDAVHAVDDAIFHEALKDAFARVTSNEDWSLAVPLARPQNYDWLAVPAAVIPVAHALGESTGEPNTLVALRRSVAAGFRFFEVDLWLQDGVVYCFHGPGPLPRSRPDRCTFESLMFALPRDAWLVLDIKTDFEATGDRVMQMLAVDGRASQAIVQLYQPEDLATFNRWQRSLPLPGPIVTAYKARRAIDSVAEASARIGVRAFTYPIWRASGFVHRPAALQLFLHPVNDCRELGEAKKQGVRGVYMENNLDCMDMPSIMRPVLQDDRST